MIRKTTWSRSKQPSSATTTTTRPPHSTTSSSSSSSKNPIRKSSKPLKKTIPERPPASQQSSNNKERTTPFSSRRRRRGGGGGGPPKPPSDEFLDTQQEIRNMIDSVSQTTTSSSDALIVPCFAQETEEEEVFYSEEERNDTRRQMILYPSVSLQTPHAIPNGASDAIANDDDKIETDRHYSSISNQQTKDDIREKIDKIQQRRQTLQLTQMETDLRRDATDRFDAIRRMAKAEVRSRLKILRKEQTERLNGILHAKQDIAGRIEVLTSYFNELTVRESEVKTSLEQAEYDITTEAKQFVDSEDKKINADLQIALEKLRVQSPAP